MWRQRRCVVVVVVVEVVVVVKLIEGEEAPNENTRIKSCWLVRDYAANVTIRRLIDSSLRVVVLLCDGYDGPYVCQWRRRRRHQYFRAPLRQRSSLCLSKNTSGGRPPLLPVAPGESMRMFGPNTGAAAHSSQMSRHGRRRGASLTYARRRPLSAKNEQTRARKHAQNWRRRLRPCSEREHCCWREQCRSGGARNVRR